MNFPQGTEARVCADIARRQEMGVKKYGVQVATNPLSLKQWLQHAYEETLDKAIYLRRVIEQIEEGEWRPIQTAPKNSGEEVLLLEKMRAGVPGKMLVGHWMPGGFCIEDHPAIDAGWYFWNGCSFDKASEPTHWMPLPSDPQERKGT